MGLEMDYGEQKKLDMEMVSVEDEFEKVPIPAWQDQITFRSIVVSAVIGCFFCIITHKLSLTVGVIPSLNVSAGLLAFFFIKVWIYTLSKMNIWSKPFTRQENTVIQTCAVACYGLAFSGGYGTYILSMDSLSYKTIGDGAGNKAEDVKDPSLGWLYAFMFCTAFIGIMVIVPLRKLMILKFKLTYPSGTATALLINSFHTPEGAVVAARQVRSLLWSGAASFFFSFFKWFFTGFGDTTCGFDNFPSLGLKAFDNKFMFDFNLTYIGAGMICPHIVNVSVLLGAIISYGIMWPLILNKKGDWYPQDAKDTSFKGLFAYKVFCAIGLILGDGLYQLVLTFIRSGLDLYRRYRLPVHSGDNIHEHIPFDEQKRNETFLREGIPTRYAVAFYVVLAVIAIATVPHIFHQVKWYYVLVCYIIAPILAFCNSYGMGLTDWSLVTTYGKLGLFVFAAWGGSDGGVIAGLGVCGVIMTIVASAADLMQDFKTGYLTRASPRSMFVSQLIGALLGCVFAPLTFWMFWKAFTVGDPDGPYKAPYGVIYRQMAIIGVEGFGALPQHCMQITIGCFFFSILLDSVRDLLPKRYAKFIPVPMAMAIPFYFGAYFAIDMFLGTVIVYVWTKLNKKQANIHVPAVASGLICGDGLWTIPAAILALSKINPPICMTFYPSKVAVRVQKQFPVG